MQYNVAGQFDISPFALGRICVHKTFDFNIHARKLQKPTRTLITIVSIVQNKFIRLHNFSSRPQSRARQQKSSLVSYSIVEKSSPIIQVITSNFQERAKFLRRIKTMFVESFQGSRKQFQSKRLVMLRTDVYARADLYTDISRKVVGKNVHATTPKGNMGYDQYAVSDTVAVECSILAFL